MTRPKKYDYNVAVIGAGAAGLVTAYISATVKAKVVLIEKKLMGGDCLYTGCVPSKALIQSAKVISLAKRAKEFGFKSGHFEFDFKDVMERIQRVIKKIAPHDSPERYQELGVECMQGTAKLTDPYTLDVDGKSLTAKNIVIASGGRPAIPALPGIEKIKFLTSDNLWDIKTLPKKLIVLGGGTIGCELAQCFIRFGSEVTIIQGENRLLPREDDEVSDFIMNQFRSEGIKILTGHKAKSFQVDGNKKSLLCDTKGQEVSIDFDEILVAVGRKPNVAGYGLEELGIRLGPRGMLETDEYLRTKYPHIFVCGDVAGPYQFTHTAAHQAWYAAVNSLFSPIKYKVDYRVIPWVTYTDPEIARVGLNEKEAHEKRIDYDVSVYPLSELDRAIVDEKDRGMIKVLTVPRKDKILGVTALGDSAGEYFVEFVTAMKYGLGLNKILGTIHAYPTLSEANKYVAGVWKKNHAPENLLKLAQRFHDWRRG